MTRASELCSPRQITARASSSIVGRLGWDPLGSPAGKKNEKKRSHLCVVQTPTGTGVVGRAFFIGPCAPGRANEGSSRRSAPTGTRCPRRYGFMACG